MNEDAVLAIEQVESIILLVRGQKVILDRDLAQLYGVTTGNLNKAVKRNIDRFPNDFMFQLTPEEYKSLRFQFGIFKKGRKFWRCQIGISKRTQTNADFWIREWFEYEEHLNDDVGTD